MMRPDLVNRVPEMDPSPHFSTCVDNRVDPSNMDTDVVLATTSPTPKLEMERKILKENEQSCLSVYFLYLLLMM